MRPRPSLQQLFFEDKLMIDPLSLNDYPVICSSKTAVIRVVEAAAAEGKDGGDDE